MAAEVLAILMGDRLTGKDGFIYLQMWRVGRTWTPTLDTSLGISTGGSKLLNTSLGISTDVTLYTSLGISTDGSKL